MKRIDLALRLSGIRNVQITSDDPDVLDAAVRPEAQIDEECIYLGHLMSHYGHFLTETTSRFWALPYFPGRRVVFYPFIFGSAIRPFMQPFLEAFGITEDRTTFLREPCRFRRIIIPDRTFHFNASVHERHLEVAQRVRRHLGLKDIDRGSLKIFLSRSRLSSGRTSVSNQAEVDVLMKELGFHVVHPQEIPIVQQIDMYARCEVMAGFSGSALHNCLFMNPGTVLIEIGDLRAPAGPLAPQILCNLASGVRGFHVPFRAKPGADPAAFDGEFLRAAVTEICSSWDRSR
jgi:capsular polysaccharide biosynthesis protein